MRIERLLIAVLFLLVAENNSYGQGYDTIRVGFYSSVNIIFDSPVEKWDMGLGVKMEDGQEVWDVLVEGASANRIKLAAGVQEFRTTNLFIETADAYYNFILKYDPDPRELLIKAGKDRASFLKEVTQDTTVSEEGTDPEKEQFLRTCLRIAELNGSGVDIGREVDDIVFYMGGIYLSWDHLYFRVYIRNDGTIPFDVGYTGFFIGDKGAGNKRRAVDMEELRPVYTYRSARDGLLKDSVQEPDRSFERVDDGDMLEMVYVFRKFTLARERKLYIQFWEGDGGERKVELVVKGKDVLRGVREI